MTGMPFPGHGISLQVWYPTCSFHEHIDSLLKNRQSSVCMRNPFRCTWWSWTEQGWKLLVVGDNHVWSWCPSTKPFWASWLIPNSCRFQLSQNEIACKFHLLTCHTFLVHSFHWAPDRYPYVTYLHLGHSAWDHPKSVEKVAKIPFQNEDPACNIQNFLDCWVYFTVFKQINFLVEQYLFFTMTFQWIWSIFSYQYHCHPQSFSYPWRANLPYWKDKRVERQFHDLSGAGCSPVIIGYSLASFINWLFNFNSHLSN